jgi:DNA-binding NarL/FixJ family response regulator
MSIRVLLIDDHAVVRDGLAALLAGQDDLEVVGCCADGLEGLQLAGELRPDVVLSDITLPGLNGIEVARQLSATAPAPRICALTMHGEAHYVRDMVAAGADGYVVKSAPFASVIDAIRALAAGGSYFSDSVRELVPGEPPHPGGGEDDVFAGLSPRERQVLQLIAEGRSSKQAAGVLGVTKRTIDHHRQSIMRKLELYSVAELTKFAIRLGLTPVDHPGD